MRMVRRRCRDRVGLATMVTGGTILLCLPLRLFTTLAICFPVAQAHEEQQQIWKPTQSQQRRLQQEHRMHAETKSSTTVDTFELLNSRHNARFPPKRATLNSMAITSSRRYTQYMRSPCLPADNGYFGSTSNRILGGDSTNFTYSFELETIAQPWPTYVQQQYDDDYYYDELEGKDILHLILGQINDSVMDAILSIVFPSVCWFIDEEGEGDESGYPFGIGDKKLNNSNISTTKSKVLAAVSDRPYTVTGFRFELTKPSHETESNLRKSNIVIPLLTTIRATS